MSWYNDDPENNFIDATQEHTGGGVAASVSEVTNTEDVNIPADAPDAEEETTIGNVLLPAVFNEENGTFDLYIRNTNNGGRIFLTTKGDGEKIKVEGGKLKLYYDYDFLNAPTIPGGWTDILDYSIASRQAILAAGANIAVIDNTLYTPVTGLTIRFPVTEVAAASALTKTIEHEERIGRLELDAELGDLSPLEFQNSLNSGINQYRQEFGAAGEEFLNMAQSAAYQGGNATNTTRAILNSRKNFGLALNAGVIAFIGGISGLAGIAFGIYDRLSRDDLSKIEEKLLIAFEKIKDEPDAAIANLLYKDGLAIQSATNGGFTTAGSYEVDIANGNKLLIEIDSNNIASITSVIITSPGFSVGDTISIPKSDLGGGVGNLVIDVNTLYSEKDLVVKLIEDVSAERDGILGRNRRRQFIPDKNNFGDGIEVIETNITEPSGEITKDLDIKLKIDTSQFQYDASGNLQLTNYANIGYTGNLGIPSDPLANPPVLATELNLAVETNTANIAINTDNISSNKNDITTLQTNLGVASDPANSITATGLHAVVEQNTLDISGITGGINITQLQQDVIQNTTDLTALENVVGTLPIYDSDGNPITISTGVFQKLDNVYKIIMEEGYTYDNNDNYKLSLGYFEPWNDYAYDLICIALKSKRTGAFDSSFYNNDWLGYFPSLTRISDDEYMTPVRDVGININNDMTFRRGLVYLEHSNPLIDYDLNRYLELVCFIKPISIDNPGVEYTILQTGVKLSPVDYDIDNSKLKIAIRDNKLELTHSVKAIYDYYKPYSNKNFNDSIYNALTNSGNTFMPEKTTQIYYTDNGIQRFWNVTHQGEYLLNPIMVARFEFLFQQTIATMTSVSYYWSYHFDLNINQVALDLNGTHASPKFGYFETTPLSNTRNNIAKIMIAFDYMISPQGGSENTLEFKQFASIAQLDNELEFKIQVNVKKFNDPNPGTIYYTKDYDFTEFEYAEQSVENIPYQLGRFYIKEMWLPTDLYPAINNLKSTPEYYNYVEFRLVPRGAPFAAPLVGTQPTDFFAGQHSIRIYAVNFFEYEPNVTNYTSYNTYTNTSITDVFPPNYDPYIWYKFVAELDLANKSFNYYINNVRSTFSFDTEIVNIEHSSIGFPNTDPDLVFYYTAPYTYVNAGYDGLVRDNDILIYGNDPSQGEMHFSHFNSKFSQTGLSGLMVDAQRNKLDNLINYNYYYETVKIPRYLNVKEFYADVLDARKILVNGGFAYEELTPSDQLLSLRSDDVSTDNVAISTAFVNIDKLFTINQNISGSLDYNHLTKTFDIIPFTNFDPLLYYDKTNTDLLFTSKVQFNDHFTPFNIFNSTFTRFELIDTEIELVDNDISYIYQHRERDTPGDISNQIVTYFFNCISNNTNLFLYRDLITNVMPPLIGSSTNITPQYAFDFNNNYLNSPKAYGGSTYNLIDTTQISVVYGTSSTNQKLVSGLAGGVSILQHNFNTVFNYNNTFSLFHRPIQLVSHGIIVYRNASNVETFNIAGVVQNVNGVDVFNYLLYIADPNGGAPNVILFSNPNNDTFLNNDNAIVLYNFGNVYHWYINGAYHGNILLSNFTSAQAIEPSKLYLDLSTIDSNCIIYDFKYFNTTLFEEIANTTEKILFNKKRLIDITQFTRINLLDDGTFILKELTPYKTIKANSLKSSSVVQYKPITTLSSRRTINVVEETSLKDISETEKYQVFDTEVEVNGNLFLENVNQNVGNFFTIYTSSDKQTINGVDNFKDRASINLNDTTNEWIFKREPESEDIQTATTKFIHDTTTLLTLKHNEIECGVDLKVGTIRFADNTTLSSVANLQSQITQNATDIGTNTSDLTNFKNDISTSHPSYIEFAKNIKLPDGTIISTTPADGLDGTDGLGFTGGSYNAATGIVTFTSDDGLGFSTGDLRGADGTSSSYTDADARSAVYPITIANSGLTLNNSGIDILGNDLWFNSIDANNRLYFSNNNFTKINAPSTTGSYVSLQVGTNDILQCYNDRIVSYKDLYINSDTNTTPTLFLNGDNAKSVSSQIIFGDSPASTGQYKQGMVIFYDSFGNFLRISADGNNDNTIDTPYAFNISRNYGNIGIAVNNPSCRLDVNGDIKSNTTIITPRIDFSDGSSMITAPTNGTDGTNGLGFTGGSYNAATGVVSFTSDDGLGFSTGDLRGTDGVDGTDGTNGLGFTGGSYNAATGVVSFTSDDGLGFSTGDLRGADGTDGTDGVDGIDGTNGLGFTGGSYNAATGIVTFSSNDGIGFSTGDLRGTDGVDGTDGTDGTNGLGFTGGSYNATTGVVTFTSDDGLGFSTGDLRASYTDADARSAVYPITQVNTGLPGTGAINLFDNNLWYNSTDGYNRLYFTNVGSTFIRAPNVTNSYVYTQLANTTLLRCGINETISYKNLHIGDGTATTPTLFLNGANDQNISSQIIFGDSGTYIDGGTYKHGMVIFYDSLNNYLRFSGDNNLDSALDTPYFLNINRNNGDISIGDNTSETDFKLKVAGNVILKSSTGANVYDSQVCFGSVHWFCGVVSNNTYYYIQAQGWWNDGNNRGFRLFNRSNNTVPFFVNSNGNVGINNTAPAHRLDVNGDIHTTTTIRTPRIDFDDGSAMTSAPFTPSYFKIFLTGTLPNNFAETKQSYFNGTNSLNVGSYTYTANEITIPATGVYEIMYNIHVRTTSGSDRQTPITHIRINDAYADGVRQGIWGSYVRFRSGTSANNREAGGTGQTMLSLSSGDKVSIWAVKEGNSGSPSIQAGSQINIKRIG